ncbi:ATP-grasp domain-containing protein [Methyloversatilis sp.]|uniref:ATP-grasp domain-containing protein n=2 Tax=Methyloversatilis sp. TaxID=2569862 RepID=UPI002732C388|nr:ATP-grasp domain-containing protein [Methyloversatilis sp.]MDP3454910.1 ATP-grasp domain-containing protein [Methyloversatilis sp.]MDP3577952.1 ATP-grasp domain-containing protein [Methyloversatilis sp.]
MKRRIFVFEFITGGGLAGQPGLPPSLLREGRLMRDALLRDAAALPDIDIILLHDARLPPPDFPAHLIAVTPDHAFDAGFEASFDHALDAADAVLIVAPETGGVLAALTSRVTGAGKTLLGCSADTCRIGASKSLTAERLSAAGIAVLPHFTDAATLPALPGRWVVKPDDGAGCDGLRLFDTVHQAAQALRPGFVAQPWMAGEARSLNLLCARGEAVLLSINRQHLAIDGEQVSLVALAVGDVPIDDMYRALARRIAGALPGLLGHVGVDVLHTADGPIVVELNPRLSTSACALHDTLGCNLLAATLAAADGGPLWRPAGAARPQRIELTEAVDAV